MIIGVTGDTHNNLKNIKKICSIFNENRVDLVIHTGDISLPKSLLEFKSLNCPMKVVLGNNDIEEEKDESVVETEAPKEGIEASQPVETKEEEVKEEPKEELKERQQYI